MNVFNLAKGLASYYFKARRALKTDDDQLKNDIAHGMTTNIIVGMNKRIKVINQNYLDDIDGCLIMSNHQDTLDIFSLVNISKKPIRFVAKKELFKIPIFKTYIQLSESYGIDRNDARQGVKVLKQVVTDVNETNANVVIFPEATRSNSDLMSDFNVGLFNIVRRCKKPILPVYIDKSYDDSTDLVTIVIGKPINAEDYKSLSATALKEFVYEHITTSKKEFLIDNEKYNILGLGDSITFGEDYAGNYTKGYYQRFIDELDNQSLLNKSYNLSVPGLSLKQLSSLLDNDNYEELITKQISDETLLNKLISRKEDTLTNIIKATDYLLFTCGANDSLELVKQGKVTSKQIYDSFEVIYDLTLEVLNKIKDMNPSIKIIVIGLYYPYPHLKNLKKFDKMETLDLYYMKLERKIKRLSYISTYLDVEENKDKFLPNKRNIHLNDDGYIYLKNKVVSSFQQLSKAK